MSRSLAGRSHNGVWAVYEFVATTVDIIYAGVSLKGHDILLGVAETGAAVLFALMLRADLFRWIELRQQKEADSAK